MLDAVRDAPSDLTPMQVTETLRANWGITATGIDYVALGDGSCNWRVTGDDGRRWFIKAERASDDNFFRVTYETAATLRDAGLNFVHAAVRDSYGELRRPVSANWDLAVFPFLDARNPDFHGDDRATIAGAIGRLHAHGPHPDVAFRWTPGYRQPELRQLLAGGFDEPWDTGPYGEPARRLFRSSAAEVEALLSLHDRLYERLEDSNEPWVVTHGEPHGGNTMIDTAGAVHLIDCNAMMIAPRERDLRLLLHVSHRRPRGLDNSKVRAAYRAGAGPVEPRMFVLELFRAEWHLMEISAYGQQFHQPHETTEGTAAHWKTLNDYLPVLPNWPELAG